LSEVEEKKAKPVKKGKKAKAEDEEEPVSGVHGIVLRIKAEALTSTRVPSGLVRQRLSEGSCNESKMVILHQDPKYKTLTQHRFMC
jgi:hypothetical protein